MARNGKSRTGTHPGLIRTRYFPRRVVTADDLTADQDYLRERLRRHNRYLHGCGIVCGLEVGAGLIETPPAVTYDAAGRPIASSVAILPGVLVTPGYALGPQGDDIHVSTEQRLFFDQVLQQDGDCSRLDTAAPGPVRLWVAVRYREDAIDPIPSLPERCASTPRCEPSRFRDDSEVALLDFLPQGCPPLPDCDDLLAELRRRTPIPGSLPPGGSPQVPPATQCPPDVSEPWVVLAAVEITRDPAGGQVFSVDYGPRAPRIFSAVLLGGILRCLPREVPLPPRVVSIDPLDRAVFSGSSAPNSVQVFFDRDIDRSTVNSSSFFVQARRTVGGPFTVQASVQLTTSRQAILTSRSPFPSGSYTVTLLGEGEGAIRSVDGLRLDGNSDGVEGADFTSHFQVRLELEPHHFEPHHFEPHHFEPHHFEPIHPHDVVPVHPHDVVPLHPHDIVHVIFHGVEHVVDDPGPLIIDPTRGPFHVAIEDVPGVTGEMAGTLRANGIANAETLATHDRAKVASLLGLSPDAADLLQRVARQKRNG